MSTAKFDPEPRPGGDHDNAPTLPLDPRAEGASSVRQPASGTDSFHPAREESLAHGVVPFPAHQPVPVDLLEHPRYRILEYLGSGGMGTVYKAEHRLMDRVVALKIINPHLVDRPAMLDRFRREVKAAARLAHPNIMRAYDADQAGRIHFLVLEFVEGVDLDRLLQVRLRLPVAHACDYARQTSLGLQHAWECGMIHRDIKPHNLMLTPEGQIKILDFGLARFISEVAPHAAAPEAGADAPAESTPRDGGAASSHPLFKGVTYAYTGVGTADYIAPEETADSRHADIRADIYSLGCTLYRCLAGRVPFPDGSLIDKLKSHQKRIPEPLTALRADLPARLVQVVERMMAKDPAQRYQTPAEVSQALLPFAVATPPPILIVDDSEASCAALARILESQGYPVICVGNGQEALDQLRRAPLPGLILLDLLMPVMDGWEFLKQQKQDPVLASIPVVIISAVNESHAKAIALGAADYLQKPIAVDELASKVQNYVP